MNLLNVVSVLTNNNSNNTEPNSQKIKEDFFQFSINSKHYENHTKSLASKK